MMRKRNINKFAVWLTVTAMFVAMLPQSAVFAESNSGDFTIAAADGTTPLAEGTDYSFDGKTLKISTKTPVTVSMADGVATTTQVIAVNTGSGAASVSFNNINIATTQRNAVALSGDNGVTFDFSGTNILSAANSGIETNKTSLKIKSENEGKLRISNSTYAISSSSSESGALLEFAGNAHIEIEDCTSHMIYYPTGPISFSGAPVVDIKSNASTSKWAIYGAGLTFSGGSFSINCDAASGTSYAICCSDKNKDIRISGTTDIHIKKARRGIYTDGGNVTITDEAKIRMYDGEDSNRTGGLLMGNAIATQKGGLTVESNAVIDVLTAGDGIGSCKTKITDNAKIYICVDCEGTVSKNALKITDNLDILKNAVVDVNVKNGSKICGVYGNSSIDVNVSDSAYVKLAGTSEAVYVGGLNVTGNASMVIKDALQKGFINGMLTVADSATFEATIADTATPGTTELVRKYTVKPAAGKAYKVNAGDTADTATAKYYTQETSDRATKTWRYFYAEPTSSLPVTIIGKNTEITYDGNAYDVSKMFDIDADAGTATYSVVAESGQNVGEGTLSANLLNITKAGTIKIKVETAANGVYLPAEATAILTVKKGTAPQITFPAAETVTYGAALSDSTLSGGSTNGAFAWKNGAEIPTVSNDGYAVIFTPSDAGLYAYTSADLEKNVAVTVNPLPIDVEWTLPQNCVYDGNEKVISAAVSNKVGSDTVNLVFEGNSNIKNSGEYNISVIGVDNENYTVVNGRNLTKTIVVEPKELTADNVSAIADVTYTGSEIKPAVECKDGDKVLVLDTDYTVAYDANKNAGTAKATISFIGNYKGAAVKQFTILLKTINPRISLKAPAKNTAPQMSIDSEEYSAVVEWSPKINSDFLYNTVYTARVNITPKANYTLDGIPEDGYLFDNAQSVKNSANSGLVVVTYPATGSRGGSGAARCSVTFETNGGSKISSKTVTRNSALSKPANPTREGYNFAGWYTDEELKTRYDFSEKVTKSFTLYAAWTEKDGADNRMILTIGKMEAQVFGQTKTNDVAPKIVSNRTMLPARFVAEGLGAAVEWNADQKLVTITGKHLQTGEDISIFMTIGAENAVVNGKEVKLDSAAFIENNRTYTPVRFIAEQLGASVEWLESEQKVIITK